MLLKNIMREPYFVDKDENIAKAFEIFDRKKETHIIVTDEGRVVGILSIKDLLRTVLDRMRWGSQRVGKLYVSAMMTPNPICVSPQESIEKIAKLMTEKGISSVIIGENLETIDEVYIITKKDILVHWDDLCKKEIVVSEVMTENPIVTHPGTSIKHAEWILRERKISTLPVLDEGELVGYIDARLLSLFIVETYLKGDIKHFDKYLETATVSDAMKAPHFVEEDQTLDYAATLLVKKRAKGTPITSSNKLVGILTETDFTRIIASK
ncbi:MAG: CBS domain-containing protein [Candidatus Njordarchaeota archaeon]